MSIIIPIYNHAAHLKEAIESVLNQNYQNLELIVLVDGLTDNTLSILESYRGRFVWKTQKT